MKDTQSINADKLEENINHFINAANKLTSQAKPSEEMQNIAKDILKNIEEGADPSRYSNLYDHLAASSTELSNLLQAKHGFIHRESLGTGTVNAKAPESIKAIFNKQPRSDVEGKIVQWCGKAAKGMGIPQEVRQEIISIADDMQKGTTFTVQDIDNRMFNRYQQAMDNAYPKLASGQMKSLNTPGVNCPPFFVTNDATTSVKASPENKTDYKRSTDLVTKYFKEQNIGADTALEFTKKLAETHPTLLFTVKDVKQSILTQDAHLVNIQAAKCNTISPNYLTEMQERNNHAIEASEWIRKAVTELKEKPVGKWFEDHQQTLKTHETTLLTDVKKDMAQLPLVKNQQQNIKKMEEQLRKLSNDNNQISATLHNPMNEPETKLETRPHGDTLENGNHSVANAFKTILQPEEKPRFSLKQFFTNIAEGFKGAVNTLKDKWAEFKEDRAVEKRIKPLKNLLDKVDRIMDKTEDLLHSNSMDPYSAPELDQPRMNEQLDSFLGYTNKNTPVTEQQQQDRQALQTELDNAINERGNFRHQKKNEILNKARKEAKGNPNYTHNYDHNKIKEAFKAPAHETIADDTINIARQNALEHLDKRIDGKIQMEQLKPTREEKDVKVLDALNEINPAFNLSNTKNVNLPNAKDSNKRRNIADVPELQEAVAKNFSKNHITIDFENVNKETSKAPTVTNGKPTEKKEESKSI